MKGSFEYISTLAYRLKAASTEVMAFKSGEKYVRMQAEHQKEIRFLERRIKQLEEELARSHSETISVRNQWFEIFEELQKESDRMQAAFEKGKDQLEKRALKAEGQRDAALDKATEQRRKIYCLETDLEEERGKRKEERGKNLKLKAQINRDYENSSLPSSKTIKHKKITNSRDPDFKKTSKTIVKQCIGIRVLLDVTEYHADTGERVHGTFPTGVVDDVNYDGSVKAFLFLLNNDCCTSIDKSRTFLSELTGGKLTISKGISNGTEMPQLMINKRSKEFALKSEQERKEMFADMLLSPVMHTDCTNAKVNGKSAYVFVCATPEGKTLYFAREKRTCGCKGYSCGRLSGDTSP